MHRSILPSSERKSAVSNIVSSLELLPEDALIAIRDHLEKNGPLDSETIQNLTGLSGQNLDSTLLLFSNDAIGADTLLITIDTALSIMRSMKKNSERIDLSWTGPIQFDVEGRTTQAVMAEMIRNAHHSIIITGYSITTNAANFVRLLENSVADGVEVIFVIHSDKNGKNLETLSRLWKYERRPLVYSRKPGSADVFFKIHAKILVADCSDLLVTSANMTWHGMSNNFEVGLRVRGSTARKADALIRNLIDSNYLEPVVI